MPFVWVKNRRLISSLAIGTVATVLLAGCSDSPDTQNTLKNSSAPTSGTEKSSLDSELLTSSGSTLLGEDRQNSQSETPLKLDKAPQATALASDQGEYDVSGADEGFALDEQSDSFAQADNKVRFASEEAEGVLRWEAPEELAYTNAKVIISGEGNDIAVRDFKPGEAIELYGDLPDGVYNWETVITPEIDPSVREQMREIRASGDFEAEQELKARFRADGSLPSEAEASDNRQSGSFIVRDGIVTPSLVDLPRSDSDNAGE